MEKKSPLSAVTPTNPLIANPKMSTARSTQKVFHGSRSLDFISNQTKSKPVVLSQTTTAPGTTMASASRKLTNDLVLEHTVTPIHPFLRYNRPRQLSQLLSRFDSTNALLVKHKTTSSRDHEVIPSRMERPHSTRAALALLNKMSEFKIIPQQLDEIKLAPLDPRVRLELKDEGLFDEVVRIDGLFVTNEQKLQYLIRSKWTLENSQLLEKLIVEYFDYSGSIRSSKLVFLEYVSAINREKLTTEERFRGIWEKMIGDYHGLADDVETLNATLRCLNLFGDVEAQLRFIHLLQGHGFAPSSAVLNSFLKQLGMITRLNNREKLKRLVGLDNVLYTALNGGTVRLLIPLCDSIDELLGLLNIIDRRFNDKQLNDEYSKFGDAFASVVHKRFSRHCTASYVEIIARLQSHNALSLESQIAVIEKVVQRGSLILAMELVRCVSGSVDKEKLVKLARERNLTIKYGKPGMDSSSRDWFVCELQRL